MPTDFIQTQVIVTWAPNGLLAKEDKEERQHRFVPLKLLRQAPLQVLQQKDKSNSEEIVAVVSNNTPFGQRLKECRPSYCCQQWLKCCEKWFCCGIDSDGDNVYEWKIVGVYCQLPEPRVDPKRIH
ncbi:uncharacterized protein [Halyomorpha halys]|uniref:uncharacterized protein n=1 Tax=Halyomorpha halys TaxID=286706 RepID=UPI0006D51DCF|nr:uncharacterized protein LOC106682101 [Halyomorpha halys]XP_014278276.1 uncharacterized protein LOC106682101 [Halyomorpha halys]XP_014278285.1 uncharacterized protein LOC106682101 [Halyomorpha halys]